MTSPLVSEALMEATWQRIGGGISESAVLRLQQTCGAEQADLTGFVIGFSSNLDRHAVELLLYLHVVVCEAFRKSGAKFRTIKPAKILRTWESAKQLVDSLREHGRSEAAQSAHTTSEPAVFRYIVDALTEDADEDPVSLTDDEFWHIVSIMKTVSDCLHDAQKSRQ
jgi:hypothetical protein